jgi:hypothetical protein
MPKFISLSTSVIRHITEDGKNSICGLIRDAHQKELVEKNQDTTDKKPLCAACSIRHARDLIKNAREQRGE